MISNNNVGLQQNVVINDWTSIRDRFLPHKKIRDLQAQLGKVRMLNHELRYEYRLRPPTKEMNDSELALLAKGMQKYGENSWGRIRREMLPEWEVRELKRNYQQRLKAIIKKMKENVIKSGNKEIKFFNPAFEPQSDEDNGAMLDLEDMEQRDKVDEFEDVLPAPPQFDSAIFVKEQEKDGEDTSNLDTLQPLFCEPPKVEQEEEVDDDEDDDMCPIFH